MDAALEDQAASLFTQTSLSAPKMLVSSFAVGPSPGKVIGNVNSLRSI
jgi:hypothetical protein